MLVGQAVNSGVGHVTGGYCLKKANAGAWAVQAGGESLDEDVMWNKQLTQAQGLNELVELLLLTFGSSHCNGFLRAVDAKLAVANEKIAPTGYLDSDFLSNKSPDLAEALQKGLVWNVVHRLFATTYPKAIEIGQTALNKKGTAEISELEGMLAMKKTYAALAAKPDAKSEAVLWELAREQALQTNPFWFAWAPSLQRFAACVTEGQLEEASRMKAAGMVAPQGVGSQWGYCGGAFLGKLASIKFSSIKQFPSIKMAAYLANCYAPVDKVDDGKYTLLKDSDVGKLVNKKMQDAVHEADGFMASARALIDKYSANINEKDKWQLLLRNDCRLFYTLPLVKKGKASRFNMEFVTLRRAYKEFLTELGAIIKEDLVATLPEEKPEKHNESESKEDANNDELDDNDEPEENDEPTNDAQNGKPTCASAAASAHDVPKIIIQSLSDMNSAKFQMEQKGFKIGVLVRHSKEGESQVLYKITNVSNTDISVSPTGLHSETVKDEVVALEIANTHWTICPKSKEQQQLDFALMQPHKSSLSHLQVVRARATLALHQLYLDNQEQQSPAHVEIWQDPTVVRSIKSHRAGALKLVPATQTFSLKTDNEKHEAKLVDPKFEMSLVKQNTDFEPISFVLGKTSNVKDSKKYFIAPYWEVPTAPRDKPEMANMTISYVEVDGFKVPVMKNKCSIKAGTVLYLPPTKDAGKASSKDEPAAKKTRRS